MTSVWSDPIVEEVHAIRKRLSKECDYDLDRLVDRLRLREERHKERLVLQCGKSEQSVRQRAAER